MRQTTEEIEALLRGRGLSLTPQRRAIVRHLVERGGHWTATELLEGLTGDFPLASRATVYSTLTLLRELGVVTALPGPSGEARYDANPESHQHFLCTRCGQLEDVPPSWFPVSVPPHVEPRFRVEHFRVVAEGLCASCCATGAT
jgi:Fur family transcriptional regulator, peroxide stress response regulator